VLSPAVEDYLKAIYDLSGEDGRASTSAIARRLGIAPASVTGMLRKLARGRPAWVVYRKNRGVSLTSEGRLRALKVLRHHRLIERFLQDTLGYSWDEVHAEADRLEHAISERLGETMARTLGDPQSDPHGQPIPGKDGRMPRRTEVLLSNLPVGAPAVVSRVPDEDSSLLRYLAVHGIIPEARLVVLSQGPVGDPLIIRVENTEATCAVSRKVACEVLMHRVQKRGSAP